MSFHNVIWNKNEAVDGYKLNKMINNDNINYQLALKAPKGVLASLDIATLSSTDRTIAAASTEEVMTTVYVYNKNLPFQKKSDETYLKRFYKICISDLTIDDNPSGTVGATGSSGLIRDLLGSLPADRGFFLKFVITSSSPPTPAGQSGTITTVFGTTLRPGRHVSGLASTAAASPRYWRTQAGEFIVPLVAQAFTMVISIVKYDNSNNPQRSYQIDNGRIWVEDAGLEPF